MTRSIFYLNYIIYYLVRLIFFFIKVFISEIIINDNNNYLNKNKQHNINNFVTYLNNKSYLGVLEFMNNNFDYSINFRNITLNYQLNIYQKSNFKFYKYLALIRVIKYIIKYPFMIKYYKTLFNSLYIYLVFDKHIIFKDKYTLCSEVYSMVSRSISIASLDYRAKCFFIDHSKFDALPYESYFCIEKNN